MHRKSLFGNFLEDGYGSPKFFSENPRSSTELSLEVSLFQSLVRRPQSFLLTQSCQPSSTWTLTCLRGSHVGFEILVETMTFVKNSDSVLTRSEVSHPKAWRKIVHQDTRGQAMPSLRSHPATASQGSTKNCAGTWTPHRVLQCGLSLPPAETPGWSLLPPRDKR